MTATRSAQTTTPGTGGADLELLASGTVGVKTPTAAVRAVNPSGDLVDLGASAAGRQWVESADTADLKTTATLGALNAAVTLDVSAFPRGSWSISWPTPTAQLWVYFEWSLDGGSTWQAMNGLCINGVTGNGPAQVFSVVNAGRAWVGQIPPGATNIRARCGIYSSGSISCTVAASARPIPPVALNSDVNLAAGTNIGTTAAAISTTSKTDNTGAYGTYWLDTTTNLAIGATFTGTTRDLIANSTGNDLANSAKAKEFRALATSDVTGTLYLEVSRDNSTWRRIGKFVATQPDASLWVASFEHPVKARYARVVYVNGGTAQASFVIESLALAA